MTGTLVENRRQISKIRESRPADFGMENALARKVRREAPAGTIDHAAREYGLTTGQAQGVVYATASRTTLNKAFKAGGWPLVIEVFGDFLGESLDQFLEQEQRRMADEERKSAERRAHLSRMAARLSVGLGLGSDGGS